MTRQEREGGRVGGKGEGDGETGGVRKDLLGVKRSIKGTGGWGGGAVNPRIVY